MKRRKAQHDWQCIRIYSQISFDSGEEQKYADVVCRITCT